MGKMRKLEDMTRAEDAPHIKKSVCHDSYVYIKNDKPHCWHCKKNCEVVK